MAEALLLQSLVKTKLTRVIITILKENVDENLVKETRKVIPQLDMSKTAVYHQTEEECPNGHPQKGTKYHTVAETYPAKSNGEEETDKKVPNIDPKTSESQNL